MFTLLRIILFISVEASTVLAVLLAMLFFISFCVSAADVAFFSLTFKDINYLKTKQQPHYKRIVQLLEDPKVLLNTLRVSKTFANIGIVLISNFFLDAWIDWMSPLIEWPAKILVISVVMLLLVEVLPKHFAAQNNLRIAKDLGWLVEGGYLVFGQISRLFVRGGDAIEKKLGQSLATSSIKDLSQAIDLASTETGNESERNILKGIVEFGNTTVKQVMRTRLDVHGLDYQLNYEGVLQRIQELNYSRLPVYNVSLDEIKGMIQTKDFLVHQNEAADFDWHKLIRPAFFVHEHMPIEDLMKDFQAKRIHFAVVVDEFGGTSGIVTMEDILEEVIGEITDEFDDEENQNKKLDDSNFVFEGKTMLNDVCRIMGLPPETFDEVKGESDSLAGLVLEVAGEIPKPSDVIIIGDFQITILEVEKNRIQKVQISIPAN